MRGHINGVCEPGCSRPYGAWTDGHVDKDEFLSAVASEFNRLVHRPYIHHGYYRILRGVMHFTSRRGRGASPVTWTEW